MRYCTGNNQGYVMSRPIRCQDSDDYSDTQAYPSYINVDSRHRIRENTIIYDSVFNLPAYPLHFVDNSNIIRIYAPNHCYKPNDRVVLENIVSKNVILKNVIMVKKNSLFVKINHVQHGMSFYGICNKDFIKIRYVDTLPNIFGECDDISDGINQYYIYKENYRIDLSINISGIKGTDRTRTFIGNIPINYLNKKHRVYLLFRKSEGTYVHDCDHYAIMLEKPASINYKDGVSMRNTKIATNLTHIKYNNLYGIPVEKINDVHCIIDAKKNDFSISINCKAILDPNVGFYNDMAFTDMIQIVNRGGGTQCYCRKIINEIPGWPNANCYTYRLDKIYKNILQIKIIGSAFPNSQRLINNVECDVVNNKLYWRNLDDGDYIYQLEIAPGNYSIGELKCAIETEFSNVIRCKYDCDQNYYNKFLTSIDCSKYDNEGYYKYHIVELSISHITDIVSFAAFRELLQIDQPTSPVLYIPDHIIHFMMAVDLRKNFGYNHNNNSYVIPETIKPFDPDTEILFIYFTENSHMRISDCFPYAYHNLYKYTCHLQSDICNTFIATLDTTTAILFNFHRTKIVYPVCESIIEIRSVNTVTCLTNFNYNYLTNQVFKANHNLKICDLIVTDQFLDLNSVSEIFVYEICTVIDSDTFVVKKYDHGHRYKFIYDGCIINFSTGTDAHFWLDQITAHESIVDIGGMLNTLSFVEIVMQPVERNVMVIRHPNHQLYVNDVVDIRGSKAINYVPSVAINKSHVICRIIDCDHYVVFIDCYQIQTVQKPCFNVVRIRYPDIFQMFFCYADTLGKILNFGDSVTEYKHVVRNVDMCGGRLNRLSMSGYDYFYIASPELACMRNTGCVDNVFAVGYWTQNPGCVVIDSVVPSVKVFNPAVPSMSEIHFEFYHPDGRLIDFNGLDHSFVLEITELYSQPIGTDINVHLNAEILSRKI